MGKWIDISKIPPKYCPACGKRMTAKYASELLRKKFCSVKCRYGVARGKHAMAKKRKEMSEARKRMHERLSKRDEAYAQSGLDVRKQRMASDGDVIETRGNVGIIANSGYLNDECARWR